MKVGKLDDLWVEIMVVEKAVAMVARLVDCKRRRKEGGSVVVGLGL